MTTWLQFLSHPGESPDISYDEVSISFAFQAKPILSVEKYFFHQYRQYLHFQ